MSSCDCGALKTGLPHITHGRMRCSSLNPPKVEQSSPILGDVHLGSANFNSSVHAYLLTPDRFDQLVDNHTAQFGTKPERALLNELDWLNLKTLIQTPAHYFTINNQNNSHSLGFVYNGIDVDRDPNTKQGWVQLVDGSGVTGYKI